MEAFLGTPSLAERALEILRRSGNPFRNYFARNPDDEVCSRYHVSELFSRERDQLSAVVDLYRYDSTIHSEVVPILGNKGAGKTHLLHSIKHGGDGGWQLLVTPGTYHPDTDFLEYVLFQVIDTLLSGGTQRGVRPIEYVGDHLTRRVLRSALEGLSSSEQLDLFPAPGLGRWARKLGLGSAQAQERVQWTIERLADGTRQPSGKPAATREVCAEVGIDAEQACVILERHLERVETHDTAGLMRRHIYQGFARSALLGDEATLASFLTYGFAELEFKVKPTRQDLVLALLRALIDIFRKLKVPVVIAFDQLEDLLLVRRTDDGRRMAEAFFAGIVQAMHQIEGLCFLVFAERGLWNRLVPSLDGYIQDRLNNPIHLAQYGTIKALRLEPPSPELVRRVVEARLRPGLEELSEADQLPSIFPFTEEQIDRIARSEPTLRDMLQQFRHLFDHLVYGEGQPITVSEPQAGNEPATTNRISANDEPVVKSVVVVQTPAWADPGQATPGQDVITADACTSEKSPSAEQAFRDLWRQEMENARSQLEPQGAITGATRELQAGLGKFLQVCHEQGVKVGPWRLNHVTPELAFGDHPTYGALSIVHWVCRDGQPWKVGIGLFLGRGPGKPKDLQVKLAALDVQPPLVDYLILLRPGDDQALSGKSKALWQDAQQRGRHVRLESLELDALAMLYGFGRWLTAVGEAQPPGQPVPNLGRFLQERCEKLLEQLCLPVQQ